MKWLLASLIAFVFSIFLTAPAQAQVSQLLITEVRLGGSEVTSGGTNYKQYATLYNQGGVALDLTGWRLQYAKADFTGQCQTAEWSTETQLSGSIASGGSMIVETQLTDNAAGALRVTDGTGAVHDMVGWGDATCYETAAAELPANNKSLSRYANCDGTYQGADSNNNANDFVLNDQAFMIITAPECQPTCLPSQQLIDGVCVDDQCSNIPDFQAEIPDGYYQADGRCLLQLLPLAITELLPNVTGSDSGKEFIELYNPNDEAVNLKYYSLLIGDKSYPLPQKTLAAGDYTTASDTDLGFTLPNTQAKVVLQTVDGVMIAETPEYTTPKDDEAWALINTIWQYTNRPTPGTANVISISDEKGNGSVGENGPKPCAANQYRSPETNRCRNVSTSESELAPCKEGQYRSEETNRCRNLASAASTLTPCKEGQYRSEETNRCRSVASATNQLTPCKEGQERNPETNRCRNVQSAKPAAADYKVEPMKEAATAFTGWWALGGIGALALGRIGWEWRTEIGDAIRKMGSFFTSGK